MINKNILSKTKNKLIVFNTVVVGVLFLVFSVFIYMYFSDLTYKNIDDSLSYQYEHLRNGNSGNGNGMGGLGGKNKHKSMDKGFIIYVWQDGEVIKSYRNDMLDYIRPYDYMSKVEEGISSYSYDGHNFREYKITEEEYVVEIIKVIDTELVMLGQLKEVLIISVLMALIIAYFVSRFITKKSMEPVEASWKNQIQFVQDASHELRTPLTIISSKLEGIMKKPSHSVEEEMTNITIAMKEVRRLRKLVSDLLRLTKEDAIVQINNEQFDIGFLLEETLTSYRDICELQNKDIIYNNKLKNNTIYSDKEKIKQVIIILLDNAIKYTKEKDSIDIDIREENQSINIEIKDSGIGIKEEDLPFIFNRFYRSGNVREQNIDGSGVGLAIAKTILSNINGEIYVRSKLKEGSKFNIIIPKK